jgi:hypothetical protein
MSFKQASISQYQASLGMLRQAITECPDSMWDAPDPPNRFWQLAYHTLFYAHLYLQPSLNEITPWAEHREGYEQLGHASSPDLPNIETLSKEEVLRYLDFCLDQVEIQVEAIDCKAESGFHWLPFNKQELQFYNIRHIQQHTGELCERLGTRAGIEVNWIGKGNQTE